jgi:putative addiction module CopG family antidote
MSNVHVSINPNLLEYTNTLIKSGNYSNKSEVFNQALRLMQEKDVLYNLQVEKLKLELEKGSDKFSELNLDKIYQKAVKKYKSKS